MTDDAFIRTILASPDDDGPRLVYADYLEEQGEAERAELIRVQCELDAKWSGKCLKRPMATREAVPLWSCCVVCDLRRRERQLLLARGFDWVPCPGVKLSRHDDGVNVSFLVVTTFAIGSGIRCRFRRGFVELVECPWADWIAHADAVLAACPIRDVTLTTNPEMQSNSHLQQWRLRGPSAFDGPFRQWRTVVSASLYWRDSIGPLLAAEWPSVKNWHLPPQIAASWSHIPLIPSSPIMIDPRFLVRGPA